jgi:hypothetical protein
MGIYNPKCDRCRKAVAISWADTDEYVASGFCPECLWGPLPRPGEEA